jgi:hypothetical protein
MNLIYSIREENFTKIYYCGSSLTHQIKKRFLLQTDEIFIDSVVFEERLLCLNSTGVLFIYNIIGLNEKTNDKEIKLFFSNRLQLPYNEEHYPTWLSKYKNIVYSGTPNSLLQIKIHSETDYSIKIINMKKVYNNFFVHLNEICCTNLKRCYDKNYKIQSSVITSEGTYYFIRSLDCSFILKFDNEAIECKQISPRNVIKIVSSEETTENILAFVLTEKGFYLSKINEINGLITREVFIIEIPQPLSTICLLSKNSKESKDFTNPV